MSQQQQQQQQQQQPHPFDIDALWLKGDLTHFMVSGPRRCSYLAKEKEGLGRFGFTETMHASKAMKNKRNM